jgi:replicative DNA helicase
MGIKLESEQCVYPGAKNAAMYVLAGLIDNPLLFANPKFQFDIGDFPEQFQKIVFGAVDHLAKSGHATVSWIDIDSYLKNYPVQYNVFTANRGVEYIQNALSIYHKDDFEAFYGELKKYRLLNELTAQGISVSDIYSEEVDPIKHEQMQRRFDELDVKKILALEEEKFIKIKENFATRSSLTECMMGSDVMKLINKDFQTPLMGLPMMSPKMTTLCFGLRKGTYYVFSAGTGVGKTRQMVGESCHLAYPVYYDKESKKWVDTGMSNKVLLISTELDHDEQTRMCLAYLSGVEQYRISVHDFKEDEKERWIKAGEIMDKYKENLYFVPVSSFTEDDIADIIEKYHQIYHVDYVFFDYLMSNEDMLAEGAKKMHISNVREDMLLLNISTTLKTLCKEEQIAVFTATQVTMPPDSSQQVFLDEHCVRGAKSIPDKADIGAIFVKVRGVDKAAIDIWYGKHPEYKDDPDRMPNAVLHFYKTRIGPYYGTKLYVHFDTGTCRMTDCFATDKDGNLREVENTEVKVRQPIKEKPEIEDAKGSNLQAITAVPAVDKNGEVRDDPLPESLNVTKKKIDVGFDF